ncbi:MAG: hypothetical protein WBG71_00315 [Leeuwenhoekiella sp.]
MLDRAPIVPDIAPLLPASGMTQVPVGLFITFMVSVVTVLCHPYPFIDGSVVHAGLPDK